MAVTLSSTLLFTLVLSCSIVHSIETYEEASIMADKVMQALTDWWTVEKDLSVSETAYSKLVIKNDYMQCCNANCVNGTPEQVFEQWIPVMGLYEKEDFQHQSVVIGFGSNFVQHQYRWSYRIDKDDGFKEIFGNSVFYINDDGLITQMHHMFEPVSWKLFLDLSEQEVQKKNNEKKTDL